MTDKALNQSSNPNHNPPKFQLRQGPSIRDNSGNSNGKRYLIKKDVAQPGPNVFSPARGTDRVDCGTCKAHPGEFVMKVDRIIKKNFKDSKYLKRSRNEDARGALGRGVVRRESFGKLVVRRATVGKIFFFDFCRGAEDWTQG